jgi:hypothetical protein
MSARFRRHGGTVSPRTGICNELDVSVTAPILDKAQLVDPELPVLANIFSSADWILVTTLRVVRSQEDEISSLRNNEILDVIVDAKSCGEDGTFNLEPTAMATGTDVNPPANALLIRGFGPAKKPPQGTADCR